LDSRDFDDGGTDVPGGIVGAPERVLVIGAGIAGLTVANALTHAGVESVVLEARDHIGGRLHTVDLAGSPVDLGASWIHMPDGNPLAAFARLAGVPGRSADPVPEMAGFDRGEGRRLTAAETADLLGLYLEGFPEAAEGLLTRLGPDASMAEAIDAFVAAAGWPAGPARRARQMLHAGIEAESADLAGRQSLRWMWNELEYAGNYFGDIPDGGYRRLADAMASGVDVLKRGLPRFSPALPPDRVAAIERLGFGRYEKVALRFTEPFWRAAGFPHLMVFPVDPQEWMVWVIGQDAFGGPVLVFHVFHSAAERLAAAGPDAWTRWARTMLADATGRPCPEPAGVAVSSWADDPWTGGGYSHIPPGASPADADLLGEPLHGRLLFAGEHTQSPRLAYADGALTSGIREAKRLLGTPSVSLAIN